ncbi:MAG: hypothetical protein IPF70_12980 [Saprospiraceae bacterium]|nr:hypothetical protein [Saprospiraceae bacterium]
MLSILQSGNAPDLSFMLQSPDKELLVYGRQLIANTADFLDQPASGDLCPMG